MSEQSKDAKELSLKAYHTSSHAVYALRYHIVLITKYRKPVLVGEVKEDLKEICTRLITEKFDSEIIEMETDIDHIHLLLDVSARYSVVEIVNVLNTEHKIQKSRLLSAEIDINS